MREAVHFVGIERGVECGGKGRLLKSGGADVGAVAGFDGKD